MTGSRRRPDDDPTAAVRRAILQLRRGQRQLAARIGTAAVARGQTEQAIAEQSQFLARAQAEIVRAKAAAERAAAKARTDGDQVDAARYELAARGLQSQFDTVQVTVDQLEHVRDTAAQHIDRTRDLLRRTQASLDQAVRAQVSMLADLERLERQRVIAARRKG